MSDMQSELLTGDEVQMEFGLHTRTLYQLRKRGDLPHVRVGKSIRYAREVVARWASSNPDRCRERLKGRSPERAKRQARPIDWIDDLCQPALTEEHLKRLWRKNPEPPPTPAGLAGDDGLISFDGGRWEWLALCEAYGALPETARVRLRRRWPLEKIFEPT